MYREEIQYEFLTKNLPIGCAANDFLYHSGPNFFKNSESCTGKRFTMIFWLSSFFTEMIA